MFSQRFRRGWRLCFVIYGWTDNSGNNLGSGSTLTIANLAVGATITCTVTPSDGTTSGASGTSSAATVVNTVPTITTASISPSSAISTSTTLTCSASATDVNDGALSVSYAWSASNGASSTGSTWQLTNSVVSPGNTISCTASATDANGSSVSSTSSSVTIGIRLQSFQMSQFLQVVEWLQEVC